MNLTYAGIGSRETPKDVCDAITEIAANLSNLSYTLYTGGATGADSAFERGAESKMIFLPWNGFNGVVEDGNRYVVPPYNEQLVFQHHPAPDRLSEAGLKLISRNSYQVLGPDLKSPVSFVICWTKDGKMSGGTGQAIRIAQAFGIPVFNLKLPIDTIRFGEFILTQK